MGLSTSGFPVLYHLLELGQTHVHWVGDAIKPSHLLSSPFLPAFSLSKHKGLFQWASSSHQVDKVLELQPQHHSLQWIFRIELFFFFLGLTSLTPLQSKGLLRVFSNTTVKSISSSTPSLLYSPTLPSIHDYYKNHCFDWMDFCWQSNVSAF